jgi:hypothetical protein
MLHSELEGSGKTPHWRIDQRLDWHDEQIRKYDFVAADNFTKSQGSAVMSSLGTPDEYFTSWLFDASVVEGIGTVLKQPPWAKNVNITIYYAMDSATSGDVALICEYQTLEEGDSCLSDSLNTVEVDDTVPGTAQYLAIVDMGRFELSDTVKGLFKLNIMRRGHVAADTATGDMHFIGVLLEWF